MSLARKRMVDSQIKPNDVTDDRVIAAFLKVPREFYLPKAQQDIAYSEIELPTVEGRHFWLARDLSKLLQALEVRATDLALVIGAGEGYSASLLNELADTVIALDQNPDVADKASDALLSAGIDRVAFVTGDLLNGHPPEAPYNVILVNGLVEYVPDAWLEQLAPGGRLGVVVGNEKNGEVRVYTKSAKSVSYHTEFNCTPPSLPEVRKEVGFAF
ncbi:MAG: protein-L-isoaspartate(D-aspartate) O-methyltransferase [Ponticaulis sp.]|nr:protein-L-isoaspartate(D-aspartate) O-methyltransferase [Ponticaulis sp.]